MDHFLFYLTEGWKHIISFNALDHQLFILALAVIYTYRDWKKVLVLVTAFTIGHSLILALSVFDIIRIPSALVEFLIPLTIIITAFLNILGSRKGHTINANYFLALFFGLIHGLGFANAIRIMLARDESIGAGLLGFNLGLEGGQIVVVLIILLVSKFVLDIIKIQQRTYIFVASVLVLILSCKMALERISSIL